MSNKRLVLVRYELIIPVMAEDREEAICVTLEDDRLYDWMTECTQKTLIVRRLDQVPHKLLSRKPINDEGPCSSTCAVIAKKTQAILEEDDKRQMKLFE